MLAIKHDQKTDLLDVLVPLALHVVCSYNWHHLWFQNSVHAEKNIYTFVFS